MTITASTIATTMISTCFASPTAVNTESSENTMSIRPIWMTAAMTRDLSSTLREPWPSAPSSAPWISLTLLTSRNRPPTRRIRSRPENCSVNTVMSGSLRLMSHVIENRSPMRVSIANPRPRTRPRCCSSCGSFDTRIDRKMMLSMPRTISSSVSVRKEIQTAGSDSISITCPPSKPVQGSSSTSPRFSGGMKSRADAPRSSAMAPAT